MIKIYRKTIEMMAKEAFDVINKQKNEIISVEFNFKSMGFVTVGVEEKTTQPRGIENIAICTRYMANLTKEEFVELVINRTESNTYYIVL